jgi:hypothetical protein
MRQEVLTASVAGHVTTRKQREANVEDSGRLVLAEVRLVAQTFTDTHEFDGLSEVVRAHGLRCMTL